MKNIFFHIILYSLFLVIELFNWLGLLCDEILYRSYKKIKISESVFIVGMPRTATTFLFNTLSEDKDRFSAMKLWEIIFAPSVTQKKFFILLYQVDKLFRGFFFSIFKKIDRMIFLQFDKIHSISFLNVEEDEYILMHSLSCSLMVFIFPKWNYIRSLIKFDQDLSDKRKKRIMRYYQRCVQKHLYVFAPDKTYLSKSPSNTSKIASLKNTFRGCKLIYTIRIPEECISSAVAMYKVYNKIFHTKATVETLTETTLNFADLWYTYLPVIENMDQDTALLLRYEDITKNPGNTIESIYKVFGYQVSESYLQKLTLINNKSASYKSKHVHSLSDIGLKTSYVRKRYKTVYENYFPGN